MSSGDLMVRKVSCEVFDEAKSRALSSLSKPVDPFGDELLQERVGAACGAEPEFDCGMSLLQKSSAQRSGHAAGGLLQRGNRGSSDPSRTWATHLFCPAGLTRSCEVPWPLRPARRQAGQQPAEQAQPARIEHDGLSSNQILPARSAGRCPRKGRRGQGQYRCRPMTPPFRI